MTFPNTADFDHRSEPQSAEKSARHSEPMHRRVFRSLKRGAMALKFFVLMCRSEGRQQAFYGVRYLDVSEGKSFERSLSMFAETATGEELLRRLPNSWGLFKDRAMLEASPAGSLAHWYLTFIEVHALGNDYYLSMVTENCVADDAASLWFRRRVNSAHDLRHILTGYGPHEFGEICLLCFRFAQTGHPGAILLTFFGVLRLCLMQRGPVIAPVLEAYRRGRRARFLDLLAWEDRFNEPLATHRAALGLTPPQYFPAPFAPEAYVGIAESAQGSGARRSGSTAERMKPGDPFSLSRHIGPPVDLIDTFGPLSGMHAAMEKQGNGMPCRLVARFEKRTAAEVEAAVEIAAQRFPGLQRRIEWIGARPTLVTCEQKARQTRQPDAGLAVEPEGPVWRYRVQQDGDDAWLTVLCAHAAADGASMLRFAEAVAAVNDGLPIPDLPPVPQRNVRRRALARWLPRFVVEQQLRYVSMGDAAHPSGVAWLTIPAEQSTPLLDAARTRYGSFAAWLAAASCSAFCEQQHGGKGRILLELPMLRDDLQRVGGFGLGIGSLLMPVKIVPGAPLAPVASRIARRLGAMIAQGWDRNFDRLLSRDPARHLRFAGLCTRGYSAPILSVSWKRADWRIGGGDGIRDLACFAASPVAHVSGHIDRNGLSLSVTSKQTASAREDLLRRVVMRLGAGTPAEVLTFDGRSVAMPPRGAPARSRRLEPVL